MDGKQKLRGENCGTAVSPQNNDSTFNLDESFAQFLSSVPEPDSELVNEIAKELCNDPVNVSDFPANSNQPMQTSENSLTHASRSDESSSDTNLTNSPGTSAEFQSNSRAQTREEDVLIVHHRPPPKSKRKVHIHPEEQTAMLSTLNLRVANKDGEVEGSELQQRKRRVRREGSRDPNALSETKGAVYSRDYRIRMKAEIQEIKNKNETLFVMNMSLQDENKSLRAQIESLKETVAAKNEALEMAKSMLTAQKSRESAMNTDTDSSPPPKKSKSKTRSDKAALPVDISEPLYQQVKEELKDPVIEGGPHMAPLPGGRCTHFTEISSTRSTAQEAGM